MISTQTSLSNKLMKRFNDDVAFEMHYTNLYICLYAIYNIIHILEKHITIRFILIFYRW